MKTFSKKGTIQKITIAIIAVLCINFIIPTYSHADFGGVLASPIIDFFCSIGDVVTNLLQKLMMGEWGSDKTSLNFSLSPFLADKDDFYSDSNKYDSSSNPHGWSSSSDAFAREGEDKDNIKDRIETIDPDSDEEGFDKGWFNLKDSYYIPVATYSPEQIFSNNVPWLDINFINPKYGEDSSSGQLQEVISSWYISLRNLALVGLLCILVYVGIRMMLSSTASDKAKYKQMFTDWIIALCILFFLHYIMSFILTMTDTICATLGGDGTYTVVVHDEAAGKYFSTNLLGLARLKTQYKDFFQKFTYFIFYIALVAYTVIFTIHYLKRLIMMAFLTMIAPLVALTYPIDKMGDSKAQAFNTWLKEYVFNALIQPFHLIIYTVFVGTAMDLAQSNILYALVVMAFILPAEGILKKLFGLDRPPLGTMGALTGFTVGSLASSIGKSKGGKGGNVGNAGGTDGSSNKPPRYERKHGTDGIDFPTDYKPRIGHENEEDLTRTGVDTRRLDPEQERQLKEKYSEDSSKAAMDRYMTQGGKQNDKGEYFNPWKDEFDADYDPTKDSTYNTLSNTEKQPIYSGSDKQTIGSGSEKQPGRFRQGVRNLVSAHGGMKGIGRSAGKAITGAAKFGAKTAFTLGAASAGAAVGMATGKGITGIAGMTAGAVAGKTMADKLLKGGGNMSSRVAGMGAAAMETLRQQADIFNGNTELEDEARAKAFMKDSKNEQYLRDKWTKEHGGKAPSRAEMKQQMDSIRPYVDEGMTDIAAITRAQKAEKFGVSAEQSAKIALLAQDRKIDSTVLGDSKQFEQRKADFTQEFINKGQNEEKAAQNADWILNVMKAQVGQQHNLGKAPTKQITSRNNQTNSNVKPNANIRTKRSLDTNRKPRTTDNTNKK